MALLVRDNVPFTWHKIDTDMEAVAVRLYLENHQHTVCSVYLPPAETFETRKIENLFNQLGEHCPILIDFNGHHP